MSEITFNALIKKVTVKSLASLDKGYEVVLQGEDKGMSKLVDAPSDEQVTIKVIYSDEIQEGS